MFPRLWWLVTHQIPQNSATNKAHFPCITSQFQKSPIFWNYELSIRNAWSFNYIFAIRFSVLPGLFLTLLERGRGVKVPLLVALRPDYMEKRLWNEKLMHFWRRIYVLGWSKVEAIFHFDFFGYVHPGCHKNGFMGWRNVGKFCPTIRYGYPIKVLWRIIKAMK